MPQIRTYLLAGVLAGALFLSACGGGSGAAVSSVVAGASYAGEIIGSKKSAGETFHLTRAGNIIHMAYGDTGLVTMNAADSQQITIVRLTQSVVANDVEVCGSRLFVLTYRSPPELSKVILYDVGSDPLNPIRQGEISLVLAPGTDLACSGTTGILAGGTTGLHFINAANPRLPSLRTMTSTPANTAVAFHNMLVTNGEVRIVTDMGGLSSSPPAPICPQGAPVPPAPDCSGTQPVDCFGKFGIRSLSVRNDACSTGWTDFRLPDSVDLEFPPASGVNTSPVNHPIAVTEDNTYLYIASTNGRRLTILNKLTDQVEFSGSVAGISTGTISSIAVNGDLLVLADGDIRLIDVQDRTQPRLSSTVYTPGIAFSVLLAGRSDGGTLAYVADGTNGLVVIEITRNFVRRSVATPVATEIPAASAAAVIPKFDTFSPMSSSNSVLTQTTNLTATEGALAEGRLLIASHSNVMGPPPANGMPAVPASIADGTLAGSVFSVRPGTIPVTVERRFNDPPLAGPIGLLADDVRIFTQNSVCQYADDGVTPFGLDPVCADSNLADPLALDGHFLEFAGNDPLSLTSIMNTLTSALQSITDPPLFVGWPSHPYFPMGLPTPVLVETGLPITASDEQTGGYAAANCMAGTCPRGLAPVAAPSSIVIVPEGITFVGSTGVMAVPNPVPPPLPAVPPPPPPAQPPPFTTTLQAAGLGGRVAMLDGRGSPFAYRRIANPRPFDLSVFDAAVTAYGLGGPAKAVADAAPFPIFPPYQLRDSTGALLDITGCSTPPCPRTPDRPASGVWYGDEEMRNPYLLPNDPDLAVSLRRTSTNTTGVSCSTVDTDPFVINPIASPTMDERSSLGLCRGVFGMAFGGSGADVAQTDDALTPDFDYFTRNPTYFASTGDGGIVLIDADSGISQISPPGTLVPLIVLLSRLGSRLEPAFDVIDQLTSMPVIDTVTGLPLKSCDPLLSSVANRDVDFRLSTGTALDCDPYLRMGMAYIPQNDKIFVANPLASAVMAITLVDFDAGTPQGVKVQHGRQNFIVSGLLRRPVDVVPAVPLPGSTTQGTRNSDLYVADRGTGDIVRITQAGQFVSLARPTINRQPIGPGKISALAISPDGNDLYITLSEGCTSSGLGCVVRIAPF